MAISGPIILVDDDHDDWQILKEAFVVLSITNALLYFERTAKALAYLRSTNESPFLILCDINMPVQNGIEFKREIDTDPQLRLKSIPFIFFSTGADKKAIEKIYREITVQGYFIKPANFNELSASIRIIIDYWRLCRHPNE
jgi:CheY-like chemotaxis protein